MSMHFFLAWFLPLKVLRQGNPSWIFSARYNFMRQAVVIGIGHNAQGGHEMQESTRTVVNTIAQILLRSWIFGFVLLAVWSGVALLMGETIHKFHGPMFGLTSHELDVIFYCTLGMLKVFVLVFFFIPWLSIRLVLKKTKGVVAREGAEVLDEVST